MTTLKRTVAAAAIAAFLFTAVSVVATATLAHAAAPIVVDDSTDPATGVATHCSDATPGNCSIRDAFKLADTQAGTDTIDVPPGTYTIGAAGGGPNCTLTGGNFQNLIVQGVGGPVTINAAAVCTAGRIISYGSSTTTLTVAHITITGGLNAPLVMGGGGGGGGIHTPGNLVLDDVVVTGNSTSASSASGGGVWAEGTVTITDSTISNNETKLPDSSGGGVGANGAIVVTNSTISGNKTGGSSATGGGIFGGAGVTVTGSTISGNTTASHGAGIDAANVSVTDSAITGNTAANWAGGIRVAVNGGITITDSTVSNNHATGGGGGAMLVSGPTGTGFVKVERSTIAGNTAAFVGAIYNNATTAGTTELKHATVHGNSPSGIQSSGSGFTATYSTITDNGANNLTVNSPTFFATVLSGGTCANSNATTTLGWNYEVGAASCGFTNAANGDVQNGATALLAALASDAGAPATRRPLPGSPLLDRIPAPGCTAGVGFGVDGRNKPRPGASACDIGAHEVQGGSVAGTVTDLPPAKGTGASHTAPATLKVKVCPAATPGCTGAAAAVSTVAPNGTYSVPGLYGAYVATAYYCKAASPCFPDGAGAVKGPSKALQVGEGAAVPVALQAGFRPDVMARTATSPAQTAQNIYSPSAPVATRTSGVKKGKSVQFVIRLENDGNFSDTILLKAASVGSTKLTVVYRDGAVQIPNLATIGRSYTLAPGAAKTVTVTITAKSSSTLLQSKTVVLKATTKGQASGAKTDVVNVKGVRS